MLDSIPSPLQKMPSGHLALVGIVALVAAILIYANFNQGPLQTRHNNLQQLS